MQIDLRTVSITPLRQTFDHLAKRLGADKPASRYLEGTMDLQPVENFQYRPTWDPAHEIFDPRRTAIVMRDWYACKDPRQFYYGTYTIARARMQETAEADFDFAEERGLAASYPAAARERALRFYLPLRHAAWASNINNSAVAAYGFGTAITQAALYHAMDQLGVAQYLTRLGMAFDDLPALAAAKQAWLAAPEWQGLRRYSEQSMVVQDWFELFIAQDLALDGLLYPLAYERVDRVLSAESGPLVSMLTRFPREWFTETTRWVDATVKTAAAESPANKALLSQWTQAWRDRAAAALAPLATLGLGDAGPAALAELVAQFDARAKKLGLDI